MQCKWKWVVLWSLWATRLVRQPTTPVRVSNGWLRGSIVPSGKYVEYLGIPYATIPKRFQAPGPEPTWDGVFDATKENIVCLQVPQARENGEIGQEDCLILNVFTPLNKSRNETLPVMVFIHGGGFMHMSSQPALYGPAFLTNKDIILVSINYRVYVRGFLCLGIKEAQGNAGLKDQVAALKWVQKNIRAFGGNPKDVTLFGQSAGSASASYHMLSPMSKGLFHKLILQSGSSLSSWAQQYQPVYTASLLAKTMGFESKDPQRLYNFFITKTDVELVNKRITKEEGTMMIFDYKFVPCVEKTNFEEPFLTEHPYDVLNKGNYNKVPVMMGITSDEGFMFAGLEKDDILLKINITKALPRNLAFPSPKIREEIAAETKKLYLYDEIISLKNKINLSRFYGEPFFDYPSIEEAHTLAKTSDQPIYFYLFKYNGWRNYIKWIIPSEFRKFGAAHGDEIGYIFSPTIKPSYLEAKMVEIMSALWANFAKYGDPTPTLSELMPVRWPRLEPGDKKMLSIDTKIEVQPMELTPTQAFWKEVYSKYRRKMKTDENKCIQNF